MDEIKRRKPRGLFLHGAKCRVSIWTPLIELLPGWAITCVEYPHEILSASHSVADISRWTAETYRPADFDFIAGHSLGGLIALDLLADYGFRCGKAIIIETSLRPANPFYRNLMTPENMARFGDQVMSLFRSEAPFYNEALNKSIHEEFDYTGHLERIGKTVHAVFGNRGQSDYPNRISDLCLDEPTLNRLSLHFVEGACHMPMLENPAALAQIITTIVQSEN